MNAIKKRYATYVLYNLHIITVIIKSTNLQTLKAKKKSHFPVFFINTRSWTTKTFYWFKRYFIPEVRRHFDKRGTVFKVLWILDNTAEHHDVEVLYMPPNSKPSFQLFDRGLCKRLWLTLYIIQLCRQSGIYRVFKCIWILQLGLGEWGIWLKHVFVKHYWAPSIDLQSLLIERSF